MISIIQGIIELKYHSNVVHHLYTEQTTIDDTEELDLVIEMCSSIHSNYPYTRGNLWFITSYDDATNFTAAIADGNAFKSFEYKVKWLGNAVANGANGI